MTDKKKTRKKRSTVVAEKMIEIIESGEFELDSKLPSELEMAKRFGVSRSTLREAFKQLEQRGVVSIKQGSGTYVKDINNVDCFDSSDAAPKVLGINEIIHKGFTLKEYQMTEYIDARLMLELKSIELAIDKMDDENYANLNSNLLKCKQLRGYLDEEYIRLDCEFHREIVKASKNAFLYQLWMLIEPCLVEQQRRLIGTDYNVSNSIKKHQRVYDALLCRNKKEAKKEMSEHIGLILGRFFTNIAKTSKASMKDEYK